MTREQIEIHKSTAQELIDTLKKQYKYKIRYITLVSLHKIYKKPRGDNTPEYDFYTNK